MNRIINDILVKNDIAGCEKMIGCNETNMISPSHSIMAWEQHSANLRKEEDHCK